LGSAIRVRPRAMLTGNLTIYLFGVAWLAHVLHASVLRALELGLYPFVPGDLVKIYLAALALPGNWRLARRFKRQEQPW
jgi:biotin transport system substrate-specific component